MNPKDVRWNIPHLPATFIWDVRMAVNTALHQHA